MRLSALTAMTTVSLIGCAVKAPESQMMKVAEMAPESWSASKMGKAGVDAGWVQSFNDKKLESYVQRAITHNADMKVARERVKQARRTAHIAGYPSRPGLVFSLNGDRSQRQLFGDPFQPFTQLHNNFKSDLAISWEPDLWGRVRAGHSAAIADAQAIDLDRKAAESVLAAEVCKAWFALGEAREQLALAQKSVQLQSESVELISERFEQNLGGEGGSASQLRLAQSDLALSKATVAQRESEVELAQRRIELLCGKYPSGKVTGAGLPRLTKSAPAGLPSQLLMRRPDIVAAERRYAASIKRVKEAKLAIFPMIKLTGSGGSASDVLKNLANGNFSTWSIGAGFTQNILTGGRVLGEKKIRDSKVVEELARLEGVLLNAFGEVESALVLDQWLAKRERQTAKAYQLSEDAVEAAQNEFIEGTGDALTLLSSQSRAVQLGSQLTALKRVRLENRVDLHLALGGDFNK